MAFLGFGNRRGAADDAPRRAVEAWARALVEPGAVVKVNEILCPDPACQGFETVILVMRPGHRTKAAKVTKPAAEVGPNDVAEAMAAIA